MLGTEAELTTLGNSEDVHEKRFAHRARLRFGWRCHVVLHERSRRGTERRARQQRVRAVARPRGRRFRRRRTSASSAAARDGRACTPRSTLRRRRGARHGAGERVGDVDREGHRHRAAREFRGRRLRRGGRRAHRAHEPRRGSLARRSARESRRCRESAAPVGRLERPRLDLRFRARRGAIASRGASRHASTASSRGCAIGSSWRRSAACSVSAKSAPARC